ncbi:hypothetical protein SAMN05216262_11661 [Colwellia chukchiensis]|uniref:Sugar transporter n=1 Tax=Colwellia chukchiensis TaxID=641665 RepID=A0A1H7RYC6_9GAMM|nr:hypothetical protein [Colwellia chukchiensis]SEL65341.1 hypothetical protein SAMN05216262_11661 [Colwellia chukchiensis]
MSENTETPTMLARPSWFMPVAIVALLWNLLGVMAFVGQVTMTPEVLGQLSEPEQALYNNTPFWATAAFALAVFAGALGSLALLMKKGICYQLFIVSLLGVLVQMFHAFALSNSFEVYGASGTIMPILVLVIAFALVRLAAKGHNNHWFS